MADHRTDPSRLPRNLGPIEVRVLGSLIEKELSTPDHYPLSLNALTSACNQSSNREPVMSLDEAAVSGAIDVLRRQSLVRSFQASGARVPKYQHLLAESADLSTQERAVLCVLMLRGPQTLGEIRSRAARLVPGDDPDAIGTALEALIARAPEPAVSRLARRPGQKEVRYAHLLAGEVVYEPEDDPPPAAAPSTDRIAALEETARELRAEVADLRAQLAEFRKQFE
jgi:uncharacterized protein YceH (UPF0502 family)